MTSQLLMSQGLLNDEQHEDKRNKVSMVSCRSESWHGTMPQWSRHDAAMKSARCRREVGMMPQ
jgi:hypothetical protein